MHPFGQNQMNYSPLASGNAPDQWRPYGNMPGGPATQLIAGMLGDSWSQSAGLVNLGFQTHQNSYDMMRQKALYERNKQTLQAASYSDRSSYEQTLVGAYKVLGVDINDPTKRADIRAQAASIASMSGYFAATAPELLDAMGGARGSSAVMAHYMTSAGRYQIDPVTGQVGKSGQSIADQANLTHSMLFAGDNYLNMKGVKAGEAGQMYDNLVRRGMAPQALHGQALTRGALSYMASQGTLDGAYSAAGISSGTDIRDLTPRQVQALEATSGVQAARSDPTAIAQANAKVSSDKLREWAGAVSAMKEIFGDAGHPNAPMAEIMNALEQMTSGTMQQMSPGRVEGIVRKMRNLASTTGLTMEGTMQLMQGVQKMQQGVGFGNNSAAFSADITMSAMGFRGGLDLSSPMWGQSNADHLTAADAQLREQARGSMYANHLGVVARLGAETGTFQGAQGANARELIAAMSGPNRNSQRVAELMRKHGLTNEEGLTRFISEQSGGRISGGMVAGLLSDQFGTQEYVNQYRLQDVVRNMQYDSEVKPLLEQAMASGFGDTLNAEGSTEASRIMLQSVQAMKEQGYKVGDAAQRTAYVASALKAQAETNPALAGLKGKSITEISGMVSVAWGYGSDASMNELGMSIADTLALQNQSTLEQGEHRQANAEREAMMQGAMSHVGKGTMMSKVISAFQGMKDATPEEIKKKIAEVMGGVDPEKLGPMIGALQGYQADYDKLVSSDEYKTAQAEISEIDLQLAKAQETGDYAQIQKLQEKREAMMTGSQGRFVRMGAELKGHMQNIRAMGTAAGFDMDAMVTEGTSAPAAGSVAKIEWPKGGFELTGNITITDERQAQLSGTTTPAGSAPNAAQEGTPTV